jgi:APA family basic amino acid/polyamine antiporter
MSSQSSSSPEQSRAGDLAAKLGLYTATMIVIGSMVGSGIFKKPALMAGQLGSPGLLVLVWLMAGLVTCFGALANAEVAGMITAVGGQYVFFRRIYNEFVGFLYGWAIFAVIQTGSIASISYVGADYLRYFVKLPHLGPELEQVKISLLGIITITPLADLGTKLVTAGTVLLLTGVNILGVVLGGTVQNIFTTLKLVAIGGVVVACFAVAGSQPLSSVASAKVSICQVISAVTGSTRARPKSAWIAR